MNKILPFTKYILVFSLLILLTACGNNECHPEYPNDIEDGNYSGQHLKDYSFFKSKIINSNFKNVRFSKSKISELEIIDSNFENAHFNIKKIDGLDAINSNFKNSTFNKSSILGLFISNHSDFSDSNFNNSELVEFISKDSKLANISFKNCLLRAGDNKVKFINTDLTNAKFVNSPTIASIDHSDLSNSFFENSIESFKLKNSKMNDIKSVSKFLQDISIYLILDNSEMNNSNYNHSEFSWLKITDSKVKTTQFNNSKLNSVSITNSDLKYSSFEGSKIGSFQLLDSDLSYTNFINTEFTDNRKGKIKIQNTKLDYILTSKTNKPQTNEYRQGFTSKNKSFVEVIKELKLENKYEIVNFENLTQKEKDSIPKYHNLFFNSNLYVLKPKRVSN